MLSRTIQSVKWRFQMARHGILHLPGREINVRSVDIGGRAVPICFPEGEKRVQAFELVNLVFFDCYRLSRIPCPVTTVLDIGANLGFFALAARRRFPAARIDCYEPNQLLEPILSSHCAAAGARYFVAAVGASAGRVDLNLHKNSLHSVSRECADGTTRQIAFAEAVGRLGTVDLVKLDCEGAEWDIFSDPRPWVNVRHIAMEYHLWARPALSAVDLEHQLRRLGFSRVRIEPDPSGDWGLAWADRTE